MLVIHSSLTLFPPTSRSCVRPESESFKNSAKTSLKNTKYKLGHNTQNLFKNWSCVPLFLTTPLQLWTDTAGRAPWLAHISTNFQKIRNDPNVILGASGSWFMKKNLKQIISWHCLFKMTKKIYLICEASSLVGLTMRAPIWCFSNL
jgi:hypothetical protein